MNLRHVVMTACFKVKNYLSTILNEYNTTFIFSYSHWHYPGDSISTFFAAKVDEDTLKTLVYEHGGVMVNVAATGWQYYKGGVFAGCKATDEMDHAVLVVGYGTDADSGEDYWLLKVGCLLIIFFFLSMFSMFNAFLEFLGKYSWELARRGWLYQDKERSEHVWHCYQEKCGYHMWWQKHWYVDNCHHELSTAEHQTQNELKEKKNSTEECILKSFFKYLNVLDFKLFKNVTHLIRISLKKYKWSYGDLKSPLSSLSNPKVTQPQVTTLAIIVNYNETSGWMYWELCRVDI